MIEILLTIIIVCLLFGSTTVFWLTLLWPAVLIVGFVVYLIIKGAVEENPNPPTNATDYHAWTPPPPLLPPPRPLLKANVDSLEIERWKAGEEINRLGEEVHCLYDEGHFLCEDSLRCYEKDRAASLREQAECLRNMVKGNRDWRTLH